MHNAFIDSQFNYTPLIWIFCRKTFYFKVEKIHHRALKVIYVIDDSYNNLLRSNSYSIHQRHLRLFSGTGIQKHISNQSRIHVVVLLAEKVILQVKKGIYSKLTKNQSIYSGANVVQFRSLLLCNNFPAKVKSSNLVLEFKTKIKNLGNIDCGCVICR